MVIHFVLFDIIKLIDVVRAIEPIFVANAKPNKRHFALCDRYASYFQNGITAAIGLYGSALIILTIYFMVANNAMRPSVCLYFIGFYEGSTELLILLHVCIQFHNIGIGSLVHCSR